MSYRLLVLFLFLFSTCQNTDDRFLSIQEDIIIKRSQLFPEWGIVKGDVEEIATILPLDDQRVKKGQAFFTEAISTLEDLDHELMTAEISTAVLMLKSELENERDIWKIDKWYKANPNFYNLNAGFQKIIRSDFSDSYKIKRLIKLSENLPKYYKTAIGNLRQTNLASVTKAINGQKALYNLFDQQLPLLLKKNKSTESQSYFEQINQSKLAIKDYLAFCKSLEFEIRDSILFQADNY